MTGVDSPREGGVTIVISSSASGILSSSAAKVGGVDLDEEEVVDGPALDWLGDDDNEDGWDVGAVALLMAVAVAGGVVTSAPLAAAVGGAVKDVEIALREV